MTYSLPEILQHGDALLLVDVQKDFCPGGKLAIADGDAIVPVLNRWLGGALAAAIPIYASRDFHPRGHLSFREQGGNWPEHCLVDSDGARFHPGLNLPEKTVFVIKGVRFDQDQNSVFDQTGFVFQLQRDGVRRLWVGGLALDICVLASVLDAAQAGFKVGLITAATRPVTAAGGENAVRQMAQAGVELL